MATNYRDMSLDDLMALIDELKGIAAEKASVRKEVLMRELASLNALTGGRVVKVEDADRKERAKPKITHRSPNGDTWSSRGAKPRWLTALIAEGHDEAEFRVDG